MRYQVPTPEVRVAVAFQQVVQAVPDDSLARKACPTPKLNLDEALACDDPVTIRFGDQSMSNNTLYEVALFAASNASST